MGANESKNQQSEPQTSGTEENTSKNIIPKGTNKPVKHSAPIPRRENDDTHTEYSYASKIEETHGSWKKSLKNGEIPAPVPPTRTKDNLLHDVDFTIVDDHALKAPKSLLTGSFWGLIQYLTDDDVWDDLVRVRAIYRWISSYDIQTMSIDTAPPPDTPLEYFSKIQCDMGNLANLFYILCTMAEVPCKVIDGITKNTDYSIGDPETTDMKAQWNAVYVQNEWRLLDLFWAKWCVKINSGDDEDTSFSQASVQRSVQQHGDQMSIQQHWDEADEEYFFTDAQQLIWTHFPDDEKWQLLKDPISKDKFLGTLYVRERSHELEVTYPNKNLVLKVQEGKVDFTLHFPPKRGMNYHFKQNFFRMLSEGESLRKLDRILHNFIVFERHDDSIHFMFNIPVLGKFRCNVFGSDPNTQGLEKYDLMCSFLVVSSTLSKECLPLPDYPKIGWGPNRISRRYGLTPITHEESSIFTDTGLLEIRMNGSQQLKLEMKLVNPFVDSANMSKYAMMYWDLGEYIVRTRLPRFGVYGLKFFARNTETMEEENVLNYLIHCSMKKEQVFCLPHLAQDTLGPHPSTDRLGIAATVHENGYIEAKDGHAKVEFMTKSDVELVGELHSNDPEAVPRMRVQQYKKGNKQAYAIDVPVKGEYAFNVYAFKKDEPHKLNNAYAFLINSHGRHIDVGTLDNKTLENSKNFWKNTKEVKAESIVTTDNEVSIPVPRGLDMLVAFLQKADRSESQSSECTQVVKEKGIDIYKVKLDDPGDYNFNIFQQTPKFLRLVSRYIITRNDKQEEMEENVKEVLEIIKEERENAGTDVSDLERHINGPQTKSFVNIDKRIEAAQSLASALKSKDPHQIRTALSEYQYNKPNSEDDLLLQGRKTLRKLEAKYDLLRAFKSRELTNIERAIAVATAANDDKSFDPQLTHAKRLRDRLASIRTMQEIVRNTDNRVVGEIRQYNQPPVGVHQTVMAALMLLGHDPSVVKTWKQSQKALGQHGDKSFLNQMSKFDPKDVNLGLAVEAKKSIEPYTAKQVHTGSAGAASIFIWVESMIKEIESNAGTLGVNKMVPEHTQAIAEVEKPVKAIPESESPAPVKRKGKAGPTLVTLESLLIESPIPPASPRKPQKQMISDAATKNLKQNLKKSPAAAEKTDGQNLNQKNKPKTDTKEVDKVDVKNLKKDKSNSTATDIVKPDPKVLNKDKNMVQSKPEKISGDKSKMVQNDVSRVNEKPINNEDQKPKTNFVSKNVKSFKPKTDNNEDDTISSYLSHYHKKQEDLNKKPTRDDGNSVDGHLSIPSNDGVPQKLVGGSYHTKSLALDNASSRSNKYVYDFDFLEGLDDNKSTVTETDQDTNNKKCYKAIYARRKEDKEAIQKMWATSVKAK